MTGIDLALLHGFAATDFTWRHVIKPLSASHHVVTLERPWAPFAEQVTATVTALDDAGLRRPVLVGHSAGAEVALGVALAEPDRVDALVLIAPVVGQSPPRLAKAFAGLPGSARVGAPLLRAASPFVGPALRRVWYDPSLVDASVVDGYRQPLLEPGVAEALWEMTKADVDRQWLLARLRDVHQPALVILGEKDRWAKPLALPDVRTVSIPRCGHLPHEEQPAQTVAEIESFLASLAAGG